MNAKNWVIFTVICIGLIFYNMMCLNYKDILQEERHRVRAAEAIELAPKIDLLEDLLTVDFITSDLKKFQEELDANEQIQKKTDALRNK